MLKLATWWRSLTSKMANQGPLIMAGALQCGDLRRLADVSDGPWAAQGAKFEGKFQMTSRRNAMRWGVEGRRTDTEPSDVGSGAGLGSPRSHMPECWDGTAFLHVHLISACLTTHSTPHAHRLLVCTPRPFSPCDAVCPIVLALLVGSVCLRASLDHLLAAETC